MQKPTLFVDRIGTQYEEDPIGRVIQKVSFGAEVVPELLNNDVEADIVIVGSAARALHFLKETEKATIGIFVYPKRELEAANALASRYPDRIRVMGWEQFVVTLLVLINEKTKKEEADANSARG